MAIGPTLQEARLKKQLTASQVAEITRMKVQIVDDLEHDDFHRIAAPIYGKGFIKLYAECVDLDPKPLIADYLRSVNGDQETDTPKSPDLTSVKRTVKATPHHPDEGAEQADQPPADDLFEFANSTRKRTTRTSQTNTSVAEATERPTHTANAPATTHHHTRSESRSILAKANAFVVAWIKQIKTGFENLRDRLAKIKFSDRLLKIIAFIIGALIVVMILIMIFRFIASHTGPRPPNDDELILFISPPEPYIE